MLLEDPEAAEWVDMLVEPDEVPQVGLWLNCGGWAPGGGAPYYNCSYRAGNRGARAAGGGGGRLGCGPDLAPR